MLVLESLRVLLLFLVVFILMMIWATGVALYYCWAGSILWGWFLVPLGFPTIGVVHLFGICLVYELLFVAKKGKTSQASNRRKTVKALYNKIDWENILTILLVPLVSLSIGYILKFWVGI